MLENIIRDVLSRFLGNYFEDLDVAPMEISFWQGNVVLRNVEVKSTAMVDFFLPFQVMAGRVGMLEYYIEPRMGACARAPVEATCTDIYLLLSPCQTAPYNAEEEELHDYLVKMKAVEEIEENQRAQFAEASTSSSTPDSSFKENLLMHLFKNIEIRIEGLHVRYEDRISNPVCPFSIGIVLKSLDAITTDEFWSPLYITNDMTFKTFYKQATLSGLGIYVNSDGNLIGDKFDATTASGRDVIIRSLQNLVHADVHLLQYMVGPISTEIRVRMTPCPETLEQAFSLPKISVEISMEHLSLGISNMQFQNLIRLVETIEFMARGRYYRKYRPKLNTYAGNYAAWWQFAIKCVLSDVQKKFGNWKYSNIKKHREVGRTYHENYYKKVVLNKTNPEIEKTLVACERVLDVFNIVLIRAQVLVKKECVDRLESENLKKYGWLTTFFGWNATQIAAEIETKFHEALNEQERTKLYKAIGYKENSLPVSYPMEYVVSQFSSTLQVLTIFITEYASAKETVGRQLIQFTLNKIENKVELRPAKFGFTVSLKVDNLHADTIGRNCFRQSPILKTHGVHFLELAWEKRPLNTSVDKRIKLVGRASEIIYNAKTLEQISRCFTIPKEIVLMALRSNAKARLKEWKENFTLQFKDWVQDNSSGELILEVDLDVPYVIIPENGELEEMSNAVIIDGGHFNIQSVTREVGPLPLPSSLAGSSSNRDVSVVVDAFTATLSNFQVLMSVPGLENGGLLPIKAHRTAVTSTPSALNLDIDIIESLISNIRDTGTNQDETNPKFEQIMSPISITATVKKNGAAETIIDAKISDIVLRWNAVSTELFRRISKSWYELDIDDGVSRLMEECTLLQTLQDTSGDSASLYVPNTVLESYIRRAKEGVFLLIRLKAEREDLGSDDYITHILIDDPPATVLLLTTQRIFFLKLTELFGKTTVLWEYKYEDLNGPPTAEATGIHFTLKNVKSTMPLNFEEKASMSIMEGTLKMMQKKMSDDVFVSTDNFEICDWIVEKAAEAWKNRVAMTNAADEES